MATWSEGQGGPQASRWGALARGLGAWSRGDHLEAWRQLHPEGEAWPDLMAYLARLVRLRCQLEPELKAPVGLPAGPVHGFELAEDWLQGAEAAARRGAWDEAVLRAQRALTWLVARHLRRRFLVDLHDVEASRLPEPMRARLAPRERQPSPWRALLLLEHAGEDPLWPLVQAQREALQAAWAIAQRNPWHLGTQSLGPELGAQALASLAAFVRGALPLLGEGASSEWAVAWPQALDQPPVPVPAPEQAKAAALAQGLPPRAPAPALWGTRPLPRPTQPAAAPPIEGPLLLPELEAWLLERQGRVRHRRVPEHLRGMLACMAEAPRAFTAFSRAVAAFYANEGQSQVELPLDPGPAGQRVRAALQALAQARKARILEQSERFLSFTLPRTGELKHDLAHWRAVHLQGVLAQQLGEAAVGLGPHLPPPRSVYGTGAVLAWAQGGPLWVTPFPGGRDHFDHLARAAHGLSLPTERVVAIALDPADVPTVPTPFPVWAVGDVALRLELLKPLPSP